MNVVGCVGGSAESRQALLSSLEGGLQPFDWLRLERRELPSASVLCAVNSADRVSVETAGLMSRLYVGTGRAGALAPDAGTDSALFGQTRSGTEGEIYLTFACRPDGASCVTVDPLGIFPLYYYSTPGFFLFSSSLWPFERHPGISPAFDPDGLIGILLSQGLVGGRTLLRGVSRLAPGAAVTWTPGQTASECAFNRMSPTSALHGRSLDEQLEAVDAALQAATSRCGGRTVLLSGGLDSRVVAGYVHEERGHGVDAVSLGSGGQFDVDFACQVAHRLGWRHRSVDVDMSTFARHARMEVQHEQLAGNFSDLSFWQAAVDLHPGDPEVITGFFGNNVLEPLRHDTRQTTFDFANAFRLCNRYGFPVEEVHALLRADRVEERTTAVIEQLRREHDAYDCEPFQKLLMFDLTHRARFLVGTVAWRLSWGARARLPYADPDVVTASLGLALDAFADRRLQRTLLQRRFPDLARLPLDTGSFFTRPLLPSFTDRLRHLGLLVYHGLVSRRERRYYHAVFDLNGPGWQGVRADAEGGRPAAEHVLHREPLLRHVPPPDAHVATGVSDFFQVGSRTKSLLAFLLWAGARDYVAPVRASGQGTGSMASSRSSEA